MQPLALATALVLAVLSAAPAPAADPPPQPGALLPLIGRTTAKRVACTALRDLVAPALAAAMDADALFSRSQLQSAAYERENHLHGDPAARRMQLVRLDQTVNLMVRDIAKISTALGDLRLSEAATDPQSHELRAALEQLQAGEEAQLNSVYSYTESGHYADIHNDDESMSQIRGTSANLNGSTAGIPRAIATAVPYQTTPTAPPTFSPATGANPDAFNSITTAAAAPLPGTPPLLIAPETRAREGAAAHAIVAVADGCR